ncbi:hypothetical protein ACT7CX_00415 [Bacillus cereus]
MQNNLNWIFEGQMTKAEKDRFDAFLVGTGSASAGFEDLYDKNNKFFDKLKGTILINLYQIGRYMKKV